MYKPIKWSDLSSPKLKAINLELTANCNYKCSFCLNPTKDFRKKGNISEKLVNKILDELDSEIKVHICGIGEPCLHPDFIQIVQKLRKKFKYISLVTNDTLFTRYSVDEVISLNIDKILFSLDYIDKRHYREIKGGDLDKVLSGIKRFSEKNINSYLQINYLYTFETQKEDIIKAFNYFNNILLDNWTIYIRQIKDLAGRINIKTISDENMLDNIFKEYIGKHFSVENWNRYLENTNYEKDDPKICRHIYTYYMLLFNGDVVPCCQDFNSELKLFNVLENNYSLKDLFVTKEYKTFFEKMENLDYSNYKICKVCKDYYRAG